MAKITTYMAKAKVTPVDRGTTAWEQAGRRIGSFYEQISQGDRQEAKSIADLWNEARAGADETVAQEEKRRGGGSGSAGRGSARDALDFGRTGGGTGATLGTGGANESAVSGQSGARGRGNSRDRYNTGAATGISRAAASIPDLVMKMLSGQALTPKQQIELDMSPGAQKEIGDLRSAGKITGLYGKDKGAIEPNPEPTDEDAAKAGYNMGDDYTQTIPGYPLTKGGSGLPDIFGTPANTTKAIQSIGEMNQAGNGNWGPQNVGQGSGVNEQPSTLGTAMRNISNPATPSGTSPGGIIDPTTGAQVPDLPASAGGSPAEALTTAANAWMNVAAAPANAAVWVGTNIWNDIHSEFSPAASPAVPEVEPGDQDNPVQ